MEYETDLSTQQAETQAQVRLPSSYEDLFRQEGDQPPSQNWPRKTFGLTKARRLRKRREFQKVFSEGQRVVGKFLCIDVRRAPFLRFGITASTRYGSAPERNRFKRLVREAFRLNCTHFPSVEINVLPRQKAKGATYREISKELLELLS